MDNRITDLSDSEFLSFLYAERDREESLNSYPGWSTWAIWGAVVTVLLAIYGILKNHYGIINLLNTGYLLSCILSLLLYFRPFFLVMVSLASRERGVDYKKVKYLKDVAPKPYLWLALVISICFSVFFPIADIACPWNIVSIGWIIIAVLIIVGIVVAEVNKNKIVRPDLDGLVFGERQSDSWYNGIVCGILSIVLLNSIKSINGGIWGNPDFELAICFAAIFFLVYLFLELKSREKMSSRMDVLLDDYIYKGRDKSDIFHQILIIRMGYGVLEACSRDLYQLKNSFDDFEPQKQKIEEVNQLFSNGTFDTNKFPNYFDAIKSASDFTRNWNNQIKALNKKLTQIYEQVPAITVEEEYKNLLKIINYILNKESELLKIVKAASSRMQTWIAVYHCEKYGGWCTRDNCKHRNERKSMQYRFELLRIRLSHRIGHLIKTRKECEK